MGFRGCLPVKHGIRILKNSSVEFFNKLGGFLRQGLFGGGVDEGPEESVSHE
jgi:hypothetical protein